MGPGRQECKITLCHSLDLFYTMRFYRSSFYHLEFFLSVSKVLIGLKGTAEQSPAQHYHTSHGRSCQPIANTVYRQIPKYRRHRMLGYAWEKILKNFLWRVLSTEVYDWAFKLMWTMFAPFRKIHDVLCFSQLILDQSTFGQHEENKKKCVLLTTWSMTGYGYYHIVDMYPYMILKWNIP